MMRWCLAFLIVFAASLYAQNPNAHILQEKSWPEVKAYLDTCDVVIISMGSTEQHGPHLPLGTDYFEALALSKTISSQTGVLVAPMVMAGYSVYHTGFPGYCRGHWSRQQCMGVAANRFL